MDLVFKDQTLDGAEIDGPLGVVPAHVIGKVKISGDDLAYATLEDDAIRAQIISGGTPLDYQMADGSMLVTAQTEALRGLVSALAEDVFSDFEHLKRKKACSISEPCLQN